MIFNPIMKFIKKNKKEEPKMALPNETKNYLIL